MLFSYIDLTWFLFLFDFYEHLFKMKWNALSTWSHMRIQTNCSNCLLSCTVVTLISFAWSWWLWMIMNLFDNRGKKLNVTSLEEWMQKGNAPALDNSLNLYNELKSRGVQIILVSSRREYLRSATIDNLVKVGYYGWTKIIFRWVLLPFTTTFSFNSPQF